MVLVTDNRYGTIGAVFAIGCCVVAKIGVGAGGFANAVRSRCNYN